MSKYNLPGITVYYWGGLGIMSAKKVFFLLLMFLAFIFILSGCGANISTKLTIDDSFSGSREIVCKVSKEDVNNKFKGGVEKIDEIIKEKCPPEFSYTKSEDTQNYIYTFLLNFTSKDDYEAKLEKILQRKPHVIFSTRSTFFVKGFRLSEDFDSADMLEWFKKVVREENLIDDVSNLWEIGDTTIDYLGQTYKTSGKVNLVEIKYEPINKIKIITEEKKDGSFNRVITFQIPNTTLIGLQKEVEDYMAQRVPKDGNGEWVTTDYGKDFIVTFDAKTAEEMALKTATVLDSENIRITYQENEENATPFEKEVILEEVLDFSAFASYDNGEVNIEYEYIPNNGSQVIFVKSQRDGKWYDIFYDNIQDGIIFSQRSNVENLKIGIKKQYVIDKVNIIMKQIGNDRYERTVVFEYKPSVTVKEIEALKKYFEDLKVPNTKVAIETDEGITKCIVSINGNSEEITKALKVLFGERNSISYFRQNNFLKINKATAMKDVIDMTSFLQMANYNGKVDYKLITKGEKIKSITIETKGNKYTKLIENQKNLFTEELPDYYTVVKYSGSIFSWSAVLLIFLIILISGGILLFVAWIVIKIGLKKSKNTGLSYKEVMSGFIQVVRSKGLTFIFKSKNYIQNIFTKLKSHDDQIKKISIFFTLQESKKLIFTLKILTVFLIVFFFFPFFTVSCGVGNNSITFNGWDLSFGKSVNTGFTTEKIDGNPIGFLLLLLPLISFIILNIKSKLTDKIKFIIISLSSFVAIVMLFILRHLIIEKVQKEGLQLINLKFKLGYTLSLLIHILVLVISILATYLIVIKERKNDSKASFMGDENKHNEKESFKGYTSES